MIVVRNANMADAADLCMLLNEIIAIGGSTAIEKPLSESDFADYFLRGSDFVSCLVAEQEELVGFQALERRVGLPQDCVDIATFARVSDKIKGVGRALFLRTIDVARDAGFTQINATIRADNVSGLGYYSAMGFVAHAVKKAVPLADGTPVDRVSKRFLF